MSLFQSCLTIFLLTWCVLFISDNATVIHFSWNHVEPLIETLLETLLPVQSPQPADCSTCGLVCLLRDVSTLRNSLSHIESFGRRDSYDDQLLAFHDFLTVSICVYLAEFCVTYCY
jgi:hypothetical protein